MVSVFNNFLDKIVCVLGDLAECSLTDGYVALERRHSVKIISRPASFSNDGRIRDTLFDSL